MYRLFGNLALRNKDQPITWRDIFAPKKDNLTIEQAFALAFEAGYQYFYFNGEIYEVECHAIWKPTTFSFMDVR